MIRHTLDALLIRLLLVGSGPMSTGFDTNFGTIVLRGDGVGAKEDDLLYQGFDFFII